MRRVKEGFAGGFLGGVFLVLLMALLQLLFRWTPLFVAVFEEVVGGGASVVVWGAGALTFCISGGVWGIVFRGLARHPNPQNGMLFGVVPTLWLWLVVAPVLLGQPSFFGFSVRPMVQPVVFNVFLWGPFVGWYCREHVIDAQQRRGA